MSGEYFSFGAGIFLLLVALLGMKAYWPSLRALNRQWLGVAIFLSFLCAAGNTLWWQILHQIVLRYDLVSHDLYQGIGWWLDVLFKGGAGIAGILHLVALHRQLPVVEQTQWRWWDMPWYPQRRTCMSRLANLFGGLK